MGINTFSFDGVSSDTYGVYITEGASYNAPERAVEMLEIPGRNGHYVLDHGRFENVEVTYHVFIDGSGMADYSANLSDLRNWLCSKVGYVRLSDTYNPNEYRMAVYKSGLDVNATSIQSGEFDIVFDCKPQRWLTSGETAVAVANGGTLDNPTLFDSEPLLAVKGYGNINFNGYNIDIEQVTIGEVVLTQAVTDSKYQRTISFERGSILVGDTITVGSITNTQTFTVRDTATITGVSFSNVTNCTCSSTNGGKTIQIVSDPMTFAYGATNTKTASVNISVQYTEGGTPSALSGTYTFNVAYNGDVSFTIKVPYIGINGPYSTFSITNNIPQITGNSTKSALGNPTYIDCDIGECYMFDAYGNIISLNSVIDLGSDLPKLISGTNTFNYDNTITEFKVTPRWWKV